MTTVGPNSFKCKRFIFAQTLNKEIARKVMQFSIDSLGNAQDDTRSKILQCITMLLFYSKLSTSNLKVLCDAAWYGM